MNMPPELKALMGQTVSVLPLASTDAFGKETTGTARSIKCLYSAGRSMIFDLNGKRIPLAYTLYTDDTALLVTDRIVIGSRTFSIANLTTYFDDTGTAWGNEAALV